MLNKRIDELKEEIISSTQENLKIKSVEGEPLEGMPFGEGVNNALLNALELSEKLGFKTKNLDGYIGYAEYGEGEDYIAVLGHLDLVPEGDGWEFDPYKAEIHDGKIYARGAADDKGPTIAALYGLYAIKDLAMSLSKRVRIIFGTNEETGGLDIPYYLEREKPPVLGFTPDAEYPAIFAEKGIYQFNINKALTTKSDKINVKYIKAGERVNIVSDYCECLISNANFDEVCEKLSKFKENYDIDMKLSKENDDILIKTIGVSAHGSMPHLGKNAIMHTLLFLNTLDITGDIGKYIEFMSSSIALEVNGKSFGVGYEDEPSGKLTFNVGIIDLDENKANMRIDIRYPVTISKDEIISNIDKKASEIGAKVENADQSDPLYFEKDHTLIKTLMSVYQEQTNDKSDPIAIGGGTYAKAMPNTVAFGPCFPGKLDVIHKPNEYIEVEELILNAKIYAHAIYELAK